VPGTDSETGLRLDSNGTVFYVDPNAVGVSDQRDGTNPTAPLRTVAAALGKCAAYSNDVIVVAPSSNWTYGDPSVGRATAITETVTVDVPGVSIIGVLPSGAMGVPWKPDANDETLITVRATDVLVEGFNFWTGGVYTGTTAISALWDATSVFGENMVVRNCCFYNIAYGIRMDYSWYNYIEHCTFHDISMAAINSVDDEGDPDYCTIRWNQFENCTAAIDLSGNDGTDYCQIMHNYIRGSATGTNNFINLTDGSDNLVGDNWLSCTIAQYDTTCSDTTSGSWGGNHCEDGDTTAAPT